MLLFCYQYDPSPATYSASILRIIRLGGIMTIVCIVGGILIFRRRDAAQFQTGAAGDRQLGERGAH